MLLEDIKEIVVRGVDGTEVVVPNNLPPVSDEDVEVDVVTASGKVKKFVVAG